MIDPEKLAQAAACLDIEPKATSYHDWWPTFWQPARDGFQFGTQLVGNDMIRVWREVPCMSPGAIELQNRMREAWAKVEL